MVKIRAYERIWEALSIPDRKRSDELFCFTMKTWTFFYASFLFLSHYNFTTYLFLWCYLMDWYFFLMMNFHLTFLYLFALFVFPFGSSKQLCLWYYQTVGWLIIFAARSFLYLPHTGNSMFLQPKYIWKNKLQIFGFWLLSAYAMCLYWFWIVIYCSFSLRK